MKNQNTSLQQTANQADDHANFLSSLRDRLKVDGQTIDNLEKRMSGKCPVTWLIRTGPYVAVIFVAKLIISRIGSVYNFGSDNLITESWLF